MSIIPISAGETSLWKVVQVVIQLIQGRCNSTGSVTLDAGGTTTVKAPNCAPGSAVFLTPQDGFSATAFPWVDPFNIRRGEFDISHFGGVQGAVFFWDVRG